MKKSIEQDLSRRERQIMQAIYKAGSASVTDISVAIPDSPSDTALRTFLRILERKGHVKRSKQGRKHIYRPVVAKSKVAMPALLNTLDSFFGGSLANAVAAHFASPSTRLDDEEVKALAKLIKQYKKKDN